MVKLVQKHNAIEFEMSLRTKHAAAECGRGNSLFFYMKPHFPYPIEPSGFE